MKALTVCQPYAELIASGQKIVENRTWSTAYRGTLAIHAGKSKAWLGEDDDPSSFIYGAVVATASLVACIHIDHATPEMLAHEHTSGPWCWVLGNVRRIQPVPCKGAQGLWEWQR